MGEENNAEEKEGPWRRAVPVPTFGFSPPPVSVHSPFGAATEFLRL